MKRRELLALTMAATATAQFTSSVRLVSVQVTVRDKRGQLVRGLTRDDFELTDEGRKQEIRYFSADSDLPLTIGVLFDISGSQRAVIAQQQDAVLAFLDQVLRDADRAFLAGFDQRYVLAVNPTGSRKQLAEGLKRLNTNDPRSNGTALFDAIVRASENLAGEPGRKALVVLSDGQDTASAAGVKDAVEEAQRANTQIYALRIFDRDVFAFAVPGQAARNLEDGRVALERLAKDTGGRMFDGKAPLPEYFSQIDEELRSQYSLGFTPVNARAGYRKLRVKVRRNDLNVRARDGYFATE
jgi:VWFA-related protein